MNEPEVAHARKTDPAESHEAASSITNLTGKQAAILKLIRRFPGMADPGIIAGYQMRSKENPDEFPPQSESGIRTRRHELVDKGLVEKAGTITLKSGRRGATWKAVG